MLFAEANPVAQEMGWTRLIMPSPRCGGSHFQGVGRGGPQREWSAFSRRGREFWAGTKPLTFDIEIEVLQDVCGEAERVRHSLASPRLGQKRHGGGAQAWLRRR